MAIRLRLENYRSKIPIRVGGILPDLLARSPLEEIQRRSIWVGNGQQELGELFDVAVDKTADPRGHDPGLVHRWEGDLTAVHEIGFGLQRGLIQVEGDAGRHVGAQMLGGTIEVQGSVSDFLGAEMQGGQIRVTRDSGDWTGGVYPGTRSGVQGGYLSVGRNAGVGTGTAMRRGMILIGGSAGHQLGSRMRAGTILVGEGIEGSFGSGMIRGTIMTTNCQGSSIRQSLGPVFQAGSRLAFPMTQLLRKWLAGQGDGPGSIERLLTVDAYQVFHGDMLRGGKGEVLVAETA
ncbi:MAG: formylmethanofuran dehydrogenase subunit C [Mariniblastus sp.]|nr:formylmethanofuran dehydrogenase subunit C [Mariniblastus sp.]